jgi:hypothetical protein
MAYPNVVGIEVFMQAKYVHENAKYVHENLQFVGYLILNHVSLL